MLIARMIGHKVKENFQASVMSPCQQGLEIFQGTICWIDVTEVGDVIAKIFLRAFINGRKPNCFNANFNKIVKPRLDP